jgi:hypothetical protein
MRNGVYASPLRVLATTSALAGLAWSGPTVAATGDCFLRLNGVPGDSADARHRGEIDGVGWSSSGGAARGPWQNGSTARGPCR